MKKQYNLGLIPHLCLSGGCVCVVGDFDCTYPNHRGYTCCIYPNHLFFYFSLNSCREVEYRGDSDKVLR